MSSSRSVYCKVGHSSKRFSLCLAKFLFSYRQLTGELKLKLHFPPGWASQANQLTIYNGVGRPAPGFTVCWICNRMKGESKRKDGNTDNSLIKLSFNEVISLILDMVKMIGPLGNCPREAKKLYTIFHCQENMLE